MRIVLTKESIMESSEEYEAATGGAVEDLPDDLCVELEGTRLADGTYKLYGVALHNGGKEIYWYTSGVAKFSDIAKVVSECA
jgi:hypothetical protein